MIIEVRSPMEGELWWKRNSVQMFDGCRNGLYLYASISSGRAYMYRCYGSASDLGHVITAPQFGSVNYGTPVDVRPHELVRGDWILAATQDDVAAFLRSQIEAYRQRIIQEVNGEVAEMIRVIENGKNPDDIPPPWISQSLVSSEGT